MLDFLLEKKDVKDVLNVKNKYGYTAFDISQRNSPPNTIISDKIQNAGGRGSFSLNWNIWYPKDQAWTNEMNNTLMVVATLIVAVTFQAAINPPGGVWQDLPDTNSASPAPSPKHSIDPSRVVLGTAIHNNINLTLFQIFMYFDTIAFSAALSIILSLLSGFSLRRRFTTWVMVISMWATLFSMGMAFAFGTLTVVHKDALKKIPYVLYSWLGTIVLVLLYHCVIFVVCLEDKIKKCWVDIMIMLGIKKDMTSDQEKKETSADHKFHHKEMMA
ncbi:uncharacterized protein LOC131241499 [Magnolia sinica]|uniref:uncharacterized protein LOC131241499 n=1 Tax=Magnolia sinica TaxID=86752 RepID=UPI00265AC065|nr:uncharacterized protein LOC131241499 [Magnolia sinica]